MGEKVVLTADDVGELKVEENKTVSVVMLETIEERIASRNIRTFKKGAQYDVPKVLASKWSRFGYCKVVEAE